MSRPQSDCRKPRPCSSCNQPVLWARNPETTRWMPIDAGPLSDGDLVLTYRSAENELWFARANQLEEHLLIGRNRYVSHFAHCPAASEHRRKRR